MTYELKVTEINTKAAKYLYEVFDENGVKISERRSNRVYVACTIHGTYYFGRLDLIGKGDHGNHIKMCTGHQWQYVKGRGKWVFNPELPIKPQMAIAYKK